MMTVEPPSSGSDEGTLARSFKGLHRERSRASLAYAVGAVLITVLVVWLYITNNRANEAVHTSTANADTVNQLRNMVNQVCNPIQNNSAKKKQLQSQDPNAAAVCAQAARGDLPVATGPSGAPGVGVANTVYTITRLGCFRVITTYTNGKQDMSDEICAPSGASGAAGSPGVEGSVGPSGSVGPYPPCFFTPSQCQGPTGTKGDQGVGIEKVDCVNQSALTIWLDGDDINGPGRSLGDGTCGPGPKGDKGDKGDAGPTCPDGYTGTPVQQLDGSTVFECVSPAPQPSTPSPNPTPTN